MPAHDQLVEDGGGVGGDGAMLRVMQGGVTPRDSSQVLSLQDCQRGQGICLDGLLEGLEAEVLNPCGTGCGVCILDALEVELELVGVVGGGVGWHCAT